MGDPLPLFGSGFVAIWKQRASLCSSNHSTVQFNNKRRPAESVGLIIANTGLNSWSSVSVFGQRCETSYTLLPEQMCRKKGIQTHLVVKSGEVCVPSENNPALILSLPDQDLKNLQQRRDDISTPKSVLYMHYK